MIRQFSSMLKWDLILLHRNGLIIISLVVVMLYIGIFYLLKPLGSLTTILVILIFNDPVVTGFFFAGIIYLFDKNQNTLSAVNVLPVPFSYYLLSKTLLLAVVATLTAFMMTFAVHGFGFNYIHLFYGVFGTAVFFILLGYLFAGFSDSFNTFLLYAIGFLMIMAMAFLSLFGIGEPVWYVLLPSFAGLQLIEAAFMEIKNGFLIYAYLYIALVNLLAWRITIYQLSRKLI